MSDTRRRRKQSGGSDDLSDSYELNATRETQSSEQTDGHRNSEYDTAGSERDTDGDSQDGGERESGDGQEEDKPQRKLDDDEDRRNPQYIPKRGTFYEHDDRTTEDAPENTTEPPPEREIKEKKVWKDKDDRWNHDRYNDDEQAPKSHEELIAVYGYDIRNEEGPPRARRRRRYGRGPNKYTRNWEDEDAYGKTAPSVTSGKSSGKKTSKSGEEFPALGGVDRDASTESVDEPVITSAWYSNKNKSSVKQQNFPPLQQQDNNQKPKSGSSNTHTNENRAPNEPTNPAWKKEAKGPARSLSPNRNVSDVGVVETDKVINAKTTTRDAKDVPKKRQVQESVSLAVSRVRGRGFRASPNNNLVGNRSVDLKPKGRGFGLIGVDTKRNNTATLHEDDQLQHVVNDAKHINPNDASYHPRQTKNFYVQSPGQQRPNTVPPRMQQQQHHPPHHQQPQLQASDPQSQQVHPQQADVAGNRPKRYSSLRQRPTIPEGPGQPQPPYPPQHPQHGFYPPQAGNTHGVVETQGFPPGHFEQPTPVGNSAAPMTGQPVIPLAPGGQPSGYAPPPFLVPPPQFITPQAAPPNIINYVPTPAGPAFPPNFQGYQGYNPTVQPQGPPPPPELFQPQGCTYYSPAQQQQQQGAPMRRPKAAIPILPPPDASNQYQHHNHQAAIGRGKTSHYRNSGVPGNTQPPVTSQLAQPPILQSAAPQQSQPETPQQSQPDTPQLLQTMLPQPSQTMAPLPSQTMAPQPSQTMVPEPSQTMAPQPSQTMVLQPSQPMVPQPSQTMAPQPSQSTAPQSLQPEAQETSETTISQSSQHEHEAQSPESIEPDNANSIEILENSRFSYESQSVPLEEEKPQVLHVTDPVTIESETPSVTTELSSKLEPKDEPAVRHVEAERLSEPAAEIPLEETSTDKIMETVELQTPKEVVPTIEPIILENNENTVSVAPKTIENEANIGQAEVTTAELSVIPDKPVIEEAAA